MRPVVPSGTPIRHSIPIFTLLLATGAMATAAPPVGSAPSEVPAQAAPTAIENLPPGTMLPQGVTAAPRMTAPTNATAPSTISVPVPAADGSDYWIISSRDCGGRPSPSNTGCLKFFHRTSDRSLNHVGRDAFFASIQPDQPVCFVVHGSYNRWNDVVTESRKISRWVHSASPGAPLQVVFFTWPSDGNMPFIFPVDIAMLGRKASQHSFYLANVVGQLPAEQPVCLLGHSHGARASVAALHLLGGGAIEDGQMLPPGYTTPRLRAVLIAAAIDSDWFNPGQRYSQALQVPEQVLLMRNSRDATLAIYPLRFGRGGRAMGRDGLGKQDRMAINQVGKKVVELDAAQFAGMNHSFADYHERTELASAIIPYVHFSEDGQPFAKRETPATPVSPVRQGAPTATAKRSLPPDDSQPILPARRAASKEGPVPRGPTLGAPEWDVPQSDTATKSPPMQGAPAASGSAPGTSTAEEMTKNGPTLPPLSLSPVQAADRPSDKSSANRVNDGPVKIYPKAQSASQHRPVAKPSPAPKEDGGKVLEKSTKKVPAATPRKRIPFLLELEE